MTNQEYRGRVIYNIVASQLSADDSWKYAFIKGSILSNLCYNSFLNRSSNDIDVLILKSQYYPIRKHFIEESGFEETNGGNRFSKIVLKSMSHQTASLYKNINGIGIFLDFNTDIFWGEYEGKRVDIEEFLSDTVEMEIYGVKVKTLPPLKTMVQLVLHHYKDMNSIFLLATRNSIRYEMFKDVYYLLKNNLEEISIEKLYKISSEYEIIPYVFYVLYYTGQVFDDDILKEYIEAFRTPEGERLLNLYGLCEKERKEWKIDFKTRLESDNLLPFIEADLTENDKEKIAINRKIFYGASE